MNKFTVLGAITALGFAGPALAQSGPGSISYSYVEVGYISTEIDDFNVDGDGFGLKGSWGFTDMFHAFAQYSDLSFDSNIDSSAFEIGAGLNWELSPTIDLIGTVSYLTVEVDASVPGFRSVSADDDGLGVGMGVRALVTNQLEVSGKLNYVEFDDAGDDTTFGVAARYYFTPMFAIGGDINFDDDGTTWIIAGRFDFGR